MHPVLVDFGTWHLPVLGPVHLALPTYGFLFALGTLAAWIWFVRRAQRLGVDPEPVFNLSFYALLAGILGAKLTLILVEWRWYWNHPDQLVGSLRAAGVLMGGVTAGAAVFVLYARARGLPLMRLGDAIAAPLALAQGVGRLGCFTAGCCYGRPADPHAWFAVTFRDPTAAAQTGVPLGVPLVPVQLMEAGFDFLLCAALAWLWRRRPEPDGTVFWIYLLAYSGARFGLEFLRGDAVRGLYFGGHISTSQIFSILGLGLALAMLWWGRRRAAAPTGA